MIHWINAIWYSCIRNIPQNKNRITILIEATVIRFLWSDLGNPAIPVGPVAFRPTIARGLALSQSMIQNFFYYPDMSKFNAKSNLFI